MNGLSAFLKQNAIVADNVKYVASKRFVDENGNPVEWEIKPVLADRDEEIRKECMKRIPVPGKKGQFTVDQDYNKYISKLTAEATAYPELKNEELQRSYGVMGAEKLLKAMLTAGEFAEYARKVNEVCGFNQDFEELKEESKN